MNKRNNQELIEELLKVIKKEKNKMVTEMTNKLKGEFPCCSFGWENSEVVISLKFELKDSRNYRLREYMNRGWE